MDNLENTIEDIRVALSVRGWNTMLRMNGELEISKNFTTKDKEGNDIEKGEEFLISDIKKEGKFYVGSGKGSGKREFYYDTVEEVLKHIESVEVIYKL